MKSNVISYIFLLSLAFIWGSSFILMKKSLVFYTDVQVASFRLLFAFLVLIPFLFKSIRNVKRIHFLPLLLVGLLGNAIPAFLFAKAQLALQSAFVGILNSLTPVFTLLLGFYFFRIKVKLVNIFGIIIGFFGAYILYSNEINYSFNLQVDIFLVIIATICYAFSINIIRKYLEGLDSITITSVSFLFVGPPIFLYLYVTDMLLISSHKGGGLAIVYIIILAVLGTAVAVILFNELIKRTSAIFASSVTYIIPIIAILWGLLDKETVTINHLTAIIIILCAVYLVNKKDK